MLISGGTFFLNSVAKFPLAVLPLAKEEITALVLSVSEDESTENAFL